MTLDPVHVDGIARLAGRVGGGVDESDQQNLAETVWRDFLDPLMADGDPVIEPLGERRRQTADAEAVALQDPPFPTSHGLDSGTINPTTFKNGLVIDVSQAAMAAAPTDLDLHRRRTIVMTVHTNDDGYVVPDDDWRKDDEGFVRQRAIRAPRVDRFEQTVVHALALYLAESEHALARADDVEDLLLLDGPIYPTGLLKWVERDTELADLLVTAAEPKTIVENYVALVERFVDRGVPLVGFVKNPSPKAITRTLRRDADKPAAPWVDDAAFFTRVLSRYDDGELRTDALSFTNWFVSRVGTDRVLGAESPTLDVDRSLASEAYEVTFFVVYDPRDDLVYRVEAPYAVTQDESLREDITLHVLRAVAAERGPPLAVAKADELARIDARAKEELRREIERQFESDRRREYDDKRWGPDVDALL